MSEKPVDFFICHASEGKEAFVKDLADQLIRNGASVFYDEYSIFAGDSLSASINKGIGQSKNVIVTLSPSFLRKKWTHAELQSAFNLHVYGETRLMTVYHNIDPEQMRSEYPLIADIKGLISTDGFEKVAEQLFSAAKLQPKVSYMMIPNNPTYQDVSPQTGWSIILGDLSFPFRVSPPNPKYVIEYGRRGVPQSRLRVVLRWNSTLCFEAVDLKGRQVRSVADISHWLPDEQHFVIASLDRGSGRMLLYCDGAVMDTITAPWLDLPFAFLEKTGGSLAGSVDLEFFCPLTLGHLAYIIQPLDLEKMQRMEELLKSTLLK